VARTDELLLSQVRLFRDCLYRTRQPARRREKLSMEESADGGGPKADRIALLVIFLALLAFTLALVAFSFPAGVYAVYSGKLSSSFTAGTALRPYFWIGPAVQFAPFWVSAGVLFAVLIATYVAFFAYSLRQQEGVVRAVSKSMKEGFGALTSSPFLVVIISIGFLNFTAAIIDALISSTGTPIGGPTGDPLELFIGFTYSPLVEEFGFRVLLIGVVAFILSLSRPFKDALSALWRPSRAIEGLAVGSGASIIIWVATGCSAVTFGACHVVCGGNTWDIGKLPEAAYGGLVLGYLYVKYGFHVAVLAHWGVDFFGSVYAFFGQAAFGIPSTSATTEYIGQYLVDFDLLFLFGLASFLVVVYLGARRFLRGRAGESPSDFNHLPEGGDVRP